MSKFDLGEMSSEPLRFSQTFPKTVNLNVVLTVAHGS